MRPVRLLAPARQEIRDAAEYYERRAKGLGVDFTDKINTAVLDIFKNPEQWPVIEMNVRRRLISRFPYCLLYRVDADEVVVLAIMHLSRHPLYWRGRK
jgi:plasmid stabilization system protein ParE